LQFPFPIDAILAGNADRNLSLEEYSDLGFSTTAKPVSRRRSAEEAALLAAAQGSWYICLKPISSSIMILLCHHYGHLS
jgi:hypothetical protein